MQIRVKTRAILGYWLKINYYAPDRAVGVSRYPTCISPPVVNICHVHRTAIPLITGEPLVFDGAVIRFSLIEHDPEKWEPVFGKDHAQSKS
jgi:hypothetical protein